MKSLFDKIADLKQQIQECETEIRDSVYRIINEVAEEHKRPKITKHIFIVKFSEMTGNVWDASFYDYERAAEILITKLSNYSSIELVSALETLYQNRLRNGICVVNFRKRAYWYTGCIYIEHKYPIKAEFVKEILDRLHEL